MLFYAMLCYVMYALHSFIHGHAFQVEIASVHLGMMQSLQLQSIIRSPAVAHRPHYR